MGNGRVGLAQEVVIHHETVKPFEKSAHEQQVNWKPFHVEKYAESIEPKIITTTRGKRGRKGVAVSLSMPSRGRSKWP